MKDERQPEPFDPAAYAHPHGPNETCNVCALLGVISSLEARATEFRIRAERAEANAQSEYERRIHERDEANVVSARGGR